MTESIPNHDAIKTRNPWDDDVEHLEGCPRHEDNHDGEEADCTCPSPEDLRAEAAEAAADAEREERD